jgi:hypothetical protein
MLSHPIATSNGIIAEDLWEGGGISDNPRDLSGDGRLDFVLRDKRFSSLFGCHGCRVLPPVILNIRNGQSIEISRLPAFLPLFEKQMREARASCISDDSERNPACAAYVADAARLGRFKSAWAEMLRHYRRDELSLWQSCEVPISQWIDHRCPAGRSSAYRDFPQSLHAFLQHTGYIPLK